MTAETTDKPGSAPTPALDAPHSAGTAADSAMLPRLLEQLMQIARTSALEEMASGFAHELNQPIGAITTFAQTGERMLALPQPMVTDARDMLHHISEQALKAGRGVHTLRNLFRVREGQKTSCDIAEVLFELEPVLQFLVQGSGAKLTFKLQAGLPFVLVDRLRIQHVIFTLVQNALEAPCDAGKKQAVEIEVEGDRYAVTTAVRDRGLGIPPDTRSQLFRPFFTTKQNGTGLGLASIRAIIEAHEGTVGCADAVGGGARFWFRLPAYSGASQT